MKEFKFGISTAYNARNKNSPQEIFEELKLIGFNRFELNVDILENWIPVIRDLVKKKEITIEGLHNFCPIVNPVPSGRNYLDAYLITSPDEEERKKAVDFTSRTIINSAELGGKYIVLHAGKVHTEIDGSDIYRYILKNGIDSDLIRMRDECLSDRKGKRDIYLSKLFKSLDSIFKIAEKHYVFVGLENRMYINEIPDFEEIGLILERYKGAPVVYWHDVGHAYINYKIGLVKDYTYFLEIYSRYLLGIHLHDVKGFVDHYAPSTGEIDFSIYKKYISENTELIFEVHPKSSYQDLKEGKKKLENIFYS